MNTTAAYDPAAITLAAMVALVSRSSATAKFNSLAVARSFAEGCDGAHRCILGDDGKIWVVTAARAQRLERAGYSFAA